MPEVRAKNPVLGWWKPCMGYIFHSCACYYTWNTSLILSLISAVASRCSKYIITISSSVSCPMCSWGCHVPIAAFLLPCGKIRLEIICLSLMHRPLLRTSVLLLHLLIPLQSLIYPILNRTGFLVQVLKEHLATSPIFFQLSHEEPKSKLKAIFLHKVKCEEGMVQENVRKNSRNQIRFFNKALNKNLRVGIIASLQITSLNTEIQVEIPITINFNTYKVCGYTHQPVFSPCLSKLYPWSNF